jgi:hypothetical protein
VTNHRLLAREDPLMFGHKMTHDGVATVISCSDTNHNMSWTSGGYTHCKYDLILDVAPLGAPMFRTQTEHSFAIFLSPSPGDQLKVRCNLDKHEVEIDLDTDPRFNVKLHEQAQKMQQQAQLEYDRNAPPGTMPSSMARGTSTPYGNIDDPELLELMRLEEQERRNGTQGS